MTAERRRRTALAALALAHALLPLAAFTISDWRPDDWIAGNAFLVVSFGEAGLLATWLGLAGAPSIGRLAAAVFGWVECFWLLTLQKPEPLHLAAFLLLPSAITIALAIAIRWTSNEAFDLRASGGRASGWQFTVGQLLAFTALVAVLIVLAQQFVRGAIIVNPLWVVSEGSQLAVVAMVWAVLRPRLSLVRIGMATVVCCAAGVIVQSYLSRSYFWDVVLYFRRANRGALWEDMFSIPVFTLLMALFAAASLRFAAKCGYTVVRTI